MFHLAIMHKMSQQFLSIKARGPIQNACDPCKLFFKYVLPVDESVWVVSFESGVWLMMEESGEVSVKRDGAWVSANMATH